MLSIVQLAFLLILAVIRILYTNYTMLLALGMTGRLLDEWVTSPKCYTCVVYVCSRWNQNQILFLCKCIGFQIVCSYADCDAIILQRCFAYRVNISDFKPTILILIFVQKSILTLSSIVIGCTQMLQVSMSYSTFLLLIIYEIF